MTAFLFLATILLWGTSWYPLALQAALAPPAVAVFHRMILAAAILLGRLRFTGRLPRRSLRDHGGFLALGVCLFSLNFVLFYTASRSLPSGVLALLFATAPVWAALFDRLLFGVPTHRGLVMGAGLSLLGLALLAAEDGGAGDVAAEDALVGGGLGLLGAVVFALGNMAAKALSQRGLPILESTGRGMAYGALLLAGAATLSGQSLAVPATPLYWTTLLYLTIGASVLAFTAYLTLASRVGAARAAFATVLFPLVALAISAAVEDFALTPLTALGVVAVLAGAGLALRRPRERAQPARSPVG